MLMWIVTLQILLKFWRFNRFISSICNVSRVRISQMCMLRYGHLGIISSSSSPKSRKYLVVQECKSLNFVQNHKMNNNCIIGPCAYVKFVSHKKHSKAFTWFLLKKQGFQNLSWIERLLQRPYYKLLITWSFFAKKKWCFWIM